MTVNGFQVARRLLCGALTLVLLQGCASLRGPDPADPLEPLNRKVTAFNDVADDLVLRPVAVIYGEILPPLVKKAIGNFFSNQSDVMSCLLYTSPSPRDLSTSRMPSSA